MKAFRLDMLATNGVAFDTETHLVQPGLKSPPLVCASTACVTGEINAASVVEPGAVQGELLLRDDALAAFEALLDDPDAIIVGAFIAFDMLVCAVAAARKGVDLLPKIFQAYEDGRVYDVLLAQALDAIAGGHLNKDPRSGGDLRDPITGATTSRYSLAICTDLVLGRKDAKLNDAWRLRYAELENVPLADWPDEARVYPIDDAVNTLEVALAQCGYLPRSTAHVWASDPDGDGAPTFACTRCGADVRAEGRCFEHTPLRNLHALADQAYTSFVMELGAAWGFQVDQAAVDEVETYVTNKRAKLTAPLQALGFLKHKRERDEDTGEMVDGLGKDKATIARAVAAAYGAHGACAVCTGTGKVPSEKNPRSKINCQACMATGFDLATAPEMPRTDPSGKFPNGQVKAGRDELFESGDDQLAVLAEYEADAKTVTTYVPYLRSPRVQCTGPDGTVHYKDRPLTLRPNPLLETDRTSYNDPIQQFPRGGDLRACLKARDGYHLCSVDYNQGEIITHAESCLILLGWSNLADALLVGAEPHKALGASMLGAQYDDFEMWFKDKTHPNYKRAKDARQAAKPANFGYPGGMGSAKLVLQQRRQGPDTPCPNGPVVLDKKGTRGYKGLRFCILMDGAERCGIKKVLQWGRAGYERPIPPTCEACLQCSDRLRDYWFQQWREARDYFKYTSACVEQGQVITGEMLAMWPWLQEVYTPGERLAPGEVMQHYSGIVRGAVEFTNASNGYFQSFLAVAAKWALRIAQRECCDRTVIVPSTPSTSGWVSAYAGGPSPLLGSRIIVFQHDELLAELRKALSHDGAMRISEIMRWCLEQVCPRMARAVKAPPALMLRWLKAAEPQYDATGRLVPWEA